MTEGSEGAKEQYVSHRAKMRGADRFFANLLRETITEDQQQGHAPPDLLAPSLIRPHLYLSSAATEAHKPDLEKHNITHVLQVGCALHTTHPESYTYQTVPVEDTAIEDIVSHFGSAFEFIDRAVESGGIVLVHCQAGVSRSPSFIIGYLMWKDKAPYEAIRQAVAAARYAINPNLGFKAQLLEFEQRGFSWDGWPGWDRDRLMASGFLTEQQKSQMYIAPKVYKDS